MTLCSICHRDLPIAVDETAPTTDELTVDARGVVRPGAYVCGACLDAAEDALAEARELAADVTDDEIREIADGTGLTGDMAMYAICRVALTGDLPAHLRSALTAEQQARYEGPHGQIYARAECARVLLREEELGLRRHADR